jgi:hypothetical protein
MNTEGRRSWTLQRGGARGGMARILLPTLAFALGLAASGCVASAADIDAEDEATAEAAGDRAPLTLKTKLEERSTGHVATESNAGGTAGIPATPDPNEPQPSPWKPNGTALSAPADPEGTGTEPTGGTTSPTATPQPSPWEGHVPPPNWPNTLPDQQTNAQ